MAFIAISLNLNMGGSEIGAVVGPNAAQLRMMVFIGRIVPLTFAINHLLASLF